VWVVTGTSLQNRDDMLSQLLVLMLAGGPVTLAIASAAGWAMAGAALRPVERMSREADAISVSEPGRRLPIPAGQDEIARLGNTLNAMLGRLEAAFDRERRFVDDASHELRTPLAILKAELDLAQSRSRTNQELQAAVRSAAEEADRGHDGGCRCARPGHRTGPGEGIGAERRGHLARDRRPRRPPGRHRTERRPPVRRRRVSRTGPPGRMKAPGGHR
jgi:HAMP domain-containing protein